ncbi:hypothetical protein T12_10922 [Trichinella patagoniensis]|uniref:Uncharacterized protein n=1 Tax=Trichinella patagoniensis TaxID=990121 RepID=A0A0V0ZR43_9BILA|nr:hypothetical protein T12_10922 [Trichinella patagoniensis]
MEKRVKGFCEMDCFRTMCNELTSDGQVSLVNDFTVSATNWTLMATARVYTAIR